MARPATTTRVLLLSFIRVATLRAKLIALDSVGAGAGETVYYCRGREASFPWHPDEVATDSTIVGIVDRVHVARKE